MEIGVYLFGSAFLAILGLVFVRSLRRRMVLYLALSALFPPVALFLFFVFSLAAGIYGTAVVRPSPVTWHTYLDHGATGAALLLLYLLGVFWPVVAAVIVTRLAVKSGPAAAG